MSQREVKRLQVIQGVIEGRVRPRQAARVLDVSPRQLRRLVQRVRTEGAAGLGHRSRGQPSNRQIAPRRKARVLKLFQTRYADFGPTFACEKLAEREGITLSDETLRGWLKAAAIPYPRRKARPHRQWRPRRAHRGELVQVDGSHHAWLETRGPAGVLMAYIDDASSEVFARLYAYEGSIPASRASRATPRATGCRRRSIPISTRPIGGKGPRPWPTSWRGGSGPRASLSGRWPSWASRSSMRPRRKPRAASSGSSGPCRTGSSKSGASRGSARSPRPMPS